MPFVVVRLFVLPNRRQHLRRLTRLLVFFSRAFAAICPSCSSSLKVKKVLKILASIALPSISSPSPVTLIKIATRFLMVVRNPHGSFVLEGPPLVRQRLLSSPISQLFTRRQSSCLSPTRLLRRSMLCLWLTVIV
ncbi:uncharacterized protein DS421_1g16150 [Arachis hypogaea]|nr:uncharacterized protein DS421_1g16150 [Arachis hypogaea]